jgi:hypothetical protein
MGWSPTPIQKILESCDSPYLRAIIRGDWRESGEGIIKWPEFDHEAVQRFLCFIYTGDYAVTESSIDGPVLVRTDGGDSKALQLVDQPADGARARRGQPERYGVHTNNLWFLWEMTAT